MKQVAFRIPEELEQKLPKPSLQGDRTKFIRDLIECKFNLDKALMIYNSDKNRREQSNVQDSDLVSIRDANPELESVLRELQYLRQLN